MESSRSRNRLARFVRDEHRYVILGTAAVAAIAYWLTRYMPTRSSFIGAGVAVNAFQVVLGAWLVLALVALVVKLTHWRTFSSTPFGSPAVRRALRLASYVEWAAALVVVVDRVVLSVADVAAYSASAAARPNVFFADMLYFVWQGRDMLLTGLATTIQLAIFGTLVAFVLALLLVFLHISKPQRRDNDFVRFWKRLGNGFYRVYVTVFRGTPMMVQGLLVFSGGFALIQGVTGFSTSQMNEVWSAFTAGFITISLNSTAYLAEVLRGSIDAVDPGQVEAARSLGLSNWQAMMKVVFPQAVRNSVPAIGNEIIINIKDSSVFTVIGLYELMNASRTIAGQFYATVEVYVVTALVYLALTLVATSLLNLVARRLDMPESRGVPSSN